MNHRLLHDTQRLLSCLSITAITAAIVGLAGEQTAAAVLQARYNPSSGNITMIAVDDDGNPTSMAVRSFWFLTNPPQLTGVKATLPTGSGLQTFNTQNGRYGVGSEILDLNLDQTTLFNDSWDLGNVAATGMTQADITQDFTTDQDNTPGGQPAAGSYLYFVVDDSAYTIGSVVVVPEPGGLWHAVAGLGILVAVTGFRGLAESCTNDERHGRAPACNP